MRGCGGLGARLRLWLDLRRGLGLRLRARHRLRCRLGLWRCRARCLRRGDPGARLWLRLSFGLALRSLAGGCFALGAFDRVAPFAVHATALDLGC